MAAYPGGIASFAGFIATHTLAQDNHAAQHNLEQAEIIATQTKLGIGASTPAANQVLRGIGVGATAWAQLDLSSDVTGILPPGNGGTGIASLGANIAAFLATPSSANLSAALTDETGTGAAVFGTNPVLVTPTVADFSNSQHNHLSAAQGGSLGSNSVPTAAIQDDAVTDSKLPYGRIYRRQGGDANAWGTGGTTNYDTSAGAGILIQGGKLNGGGNNTDNTITFPVAYVNTPLIFATAYSSGGNYPTWYIVSDSNTSFIFRIGGSVLSFSWLSIGV